MTKNELLLTQTIVRNEGVLASQIDSESVLFEPTSGAYLGLDTVGSIIWQKLETPMTIETLIDELTTEFDVDRELCLQDTIPFLTLLLEKNIISLR